MNILIIGKYPPLQGGVSAEVFFSSSAAANAGHNIHIVTNRIAIGGDELRHPAVKVHRTSRIGQNSFIPWARPDLSQLVGRSLCVTESEEFDLVVGWYMEPYGVAAAYVATICSLPLAIIHAGSDIGRLAQNADLRYTYESVIDTAKYIVVAGDTARDKLKKLGLRDSQVVTAKACAIDTSGMKTKLPRNKRGRVASDLHQLLKPACSKAWISEVYAGAGDKVRDFVLRNHPSKDLLSEATPVIGIFGKAHPAKGIEFLLEAASRIYQKSARRFRVLLPLSGDEDKLYDIFEQIESSFPDLQRRLILCPIVHPALMPRLLNSCDIVCVLDHQFSVSPHQPRMIRESLSAGTALLASSESVRKSGLEQFLIDRTNYLRVENPSNIGLLASKLELLLKDRSLRRRLQISGQSFSKMFEQKATGGGPLAALIEAEAAPRIQLNKWKESDASIGGKGKQA